MIEDVIMKAESGLENSDVLAVEEQKKSESLTIYCHGCGWTDNSGVEFGSCPQCESRDLSPESDPEWNKILKSLWAPCKGWNPTHGWNLATWFLKHPHMWQAWLEEKKWLENFNMPAPQHWQNSPRWWLSFCLIERWGIQFHSFDDLLRFKRIREAAENYRIYYSPPRETPRHGALGDPHKEYPTITVECTRCQWSAKWKAKPNEVLAWRCPLCDAVDLTVDYPNHGFLRLWSRANGWSDTTMPVGTWISSHPERFEAYQDAKKWLSAFDSPLPNHRHDAKLYFLDTVKERMKFKLIENGELLRHSIIARNADRYARKHQRKPVEWEPAGKSWIARTTEVIKEALA